MAKLGTFKSLRFPSELGTDEAPAYIRFTPQQVKYGGTTGLNGVNSPSVSGGSRSSYLAGSAGNPFEQIAQQVGGVIDSFANGASQAVSAISNVFDTASLSSSVSNLGKILSGTVRIGNFQLNFGQKTNPDELFSLGSISLFLPNTLSTGSSVDYGATELGGIGSAVTRQLESGVDKIDVGGLASGMVQDLMTLSDKQVAVNAMSTGLVANNFSYQIFNGVPHRNFEYEFKMVAKSENESVSIRDICDSFLWYMLPARVQQGAGTTSLHFYEVPCQWKIEYLKQGNRLEYHQQPFACFLTSVNVDYGSGGESAATYTDGAPIEVSLKLSFVEIEPIYRRGDNPNASSSDSVVSG